MKHLKLVGKILAIAAFWLGIWAFAAWRVGLPLLFPSPAAVLRRLFELMRTPAFYQITATSILNVSIGVLIAIVGGCLLAIITSRASWIRDTVLPIMTAIKATPVASFIILVLFCLGASRTPSFITILIVLPVVWTNLDEGYKKIDPLLVEVTRVYQMPLLRRLRVLTLPSLKPFFVSACRTSIGLAWKAGIAAEILVMPRNTIGTMIYESKLYIMGEDLFAWTLTVVLLSLLIEFAFSALFKRIGKDDKAGGDQA